MDPTKDLDIWAFECTESVQLAAAQALQDNGVVIPSEGTWNPCLKASGCFGLPVDWDYQETLSCPYASSDQEYLFQLPRVFVECVNSLLECTNYEGLFRKAGSVSRQKAIRSDLEEGASIPSDGNVHDVAAILKQYLRQLPDPLLTHHLSPVFEACVTLVPEGEQVSCLLLACLLLPAPNLQCLCVLMSLLKAVSEQKSSLMSSGSLAIIMAPNLLRSPTENQLVLPSGNSLIAQTTIVQKLIENSALIGRVPHKVGVASARYKEVQVSNQSEDIVEDRKTLLSSRCGGKTKKHRTSSISGIVLGLGNRLRQKGTAMFGGDPANGARKKGTLKRKGRSHEDLLESGTAGKINVEEIRHSLRNRRSANIPRPRLRPQATRQHPPPTEPTVTTDFHMTPSMEFTRQAQSLTTSGAHVSDTEPTHAQSCKKLKQLQCDRLSPAAVCCPSSRKLSPKKPSNQSKFPASQSDFALARVSASPLKAPPTFALPKRVTISPIFDSPSARPSSVEYSSHYNNGSQFSFSLPTPIHPLSVNHLLVEQQEKIQNSNAKSSSLLVSLSSPRYSELDQAFLRTPFPTANSPNLMDKINSEMAQRNTLSTCDSSQPWYTSYTPANIYRESLQPINESYRRAVCRGNAIGAQPTITGGAGRIAKQQLENSNISIEDTNDLNMPYPRLSLKFDISSSSSNESISSANSTSDSTLEQHTKQVTDSTTTVCPSSNTSNQTKPSSKLTSTMNRTKQTNSFKLAKSPGRKLSTRMKASPTARKRYDYSATLGIGESLIQARARQSMKLASPSRKLYSHSACLGITSLERESLQRASKRASRTQNSKIVTRSSKDQTGANNSSSLEHLCNLYSPQKEVIRKSESDSSYTLSIDLQSPDSPAPALLKILETNVAQSQKEERAKRAVNLHRTPVPPVCTLTRKALVDVRSNQQALTRELMKETDTNKPPLTPFQRVLKSPWISKPGKTSSSVGTSDASRAELYEVKRSSAKFEPGSTCSGQGISTKENVHVAGNSDCKLSLTREGVEFREWIL